MLPPRRSPASTPRLLRHLQPALEQAAALPGMDRYRKAFPARAHLWMLVLHVLHGSPSLRQTHARLGMREHLWQQWGMARWISRPQLTRSSTSRPLDGAEHLFHSLLNAGHRPPCGLSSRSTSWTAPICAVVPGVSMVMDTVHQTWLSSVDLIWGASSPAILCSKAVARLYGWGLRDCSMVV